MVQMNASKIHSCLFLSRFDRSLTTLFCIASGLAGWTDVLPDMANGGPIGADFFFVAIFYVVMCWTLLQVDTKASLRPLSLINRMQSNLILRRKPFWGIVIIIFLGWSTCIESFLAVAVSTK